MDVKLRLFEVCGHLVDAGLGAGFILVAARCAGNADGTDHVVTDHDRQRALRRGDVGQKERTGVRVAFDVVCKFAGGNVAWLAMSPRKRMSTSALRPSTCADTL